MRLVWPRRRARSKAKGRLFAPTKPDSSQPRRSEFLCANRGFATARSTIARSHRRKTRRAKSLRTVWYRARANRARPGNGADFSFDRAKDDRCVRSRPVLDREAPPSLAWRLPRTRRKEGQVLSRVATARFSARPKKLRRACLRCPPKFRLDYSARAENVRDRSRATVSINLAACARRFGRPARE